jgi:AhpD family alkylhydroperoxidase
MQSRIELSKTNTAAYQAMLHLERYVRGSGIDPALLELIKIRASQINGCAFCIDMHTKDARSQGETEQRIYALNAWRETPFFTPQEQAALALTEAVTLIATNHVSDELYDEVSRYFTEDEIVNLLMAIVTINSWNRIAIATQTVPGSYEPQAFRQQREQVV